jgi:3-methyladenine DNA glycosylase AlkD
MPALPPIEELQADLAALGDEQKAAWWDRYLKGEAQFRGVPTPAIRSTSRAWWLRHAGDDLDADLQLSVCLALLRCRMTEDKLAGMLLLGERLIPAGRIECAVAVPQFAALFDEGHLSDWNVVDWFCVRVLGPFIDQGDGVCARSIASWVDAAVSWQRRAALVGFVVVAPRGDHAELIIETAERLVLDQERFSQTGTAWVIRELSTSRPDLTESFLERHEDDMSPEARKQARGRRR